jgi:acyl-coenzyme A synthetase/AMP-(fatty) acid ligase
MDDDGYIVHLGRRNELMNAGGFRVSPAEVEQELARHPDVAEVGVSEIAVRDGVSIIAAFIVPLVPFKPGISDDLASFASTCLAAYKRPKKYVIVDALPRTPNGKLKRAELKMAPATNLHE